MWLAERKNYRLYTRLSYCSMSPSTKAIDNVIFFDTVLCAYWSVRLHISPIYFCVLTDMSQYDWPPLFVYQVLKMVNLLAILRNIFNIHVAVATTRLAPKAVLSSISRGSIRLLHLLQVSFLIAFTEHYKKSAIFTYAG